MPVLPWATGPLPPLSAFVVTYGGPSLVMSVLSVLVLPLLHATILRRHVQAGWRRLAAVVGLWLGALVGVYADVLLHAREIQQLCIAAREVKVFATASAEGFIGAVDLEPWAAAGFRYIEHAGGRRTRAEMHGSLVVEQDITAFRARHELVTHDDPPTAGFQRRHLQMRERDGGQVLGEILVYRLLAGWVDRLLMSGLGSPQAPVCVGGRPGLPSDFPFPEDALIAATLRPPGFPPPVPPRRAAP
jgi:hypothetical protein